MIKGSNMSSHSHPMLPSKALKFASWYCWQPVILTVPDHEWARDSVWFDRGDQQTWLDRGGVSDECWGKKNASFTAWCAVFLLRLNYLKIPHETIHPKLHLHLLFTRVFMLLTTISGSNYILTYAHKSTLNIQVTQTSWLSDINFTVFILQIIHL